MNSTNSITRRAVRAVVVIAMLLSFSASQSHATDNSSELSASEKGTDEYGAAQKTGRDKKSTKGVKRGKSRSEGTESRTEAVGRTGAQVGANSALDLRLPVQTLFALPVSHSLLPSDFGWTGQLRSGAVDVSQADYYRQKASVNSPLSPAEQAKIRDYFLQVARGGARVGQAMLNLEQDVPRIGKATRNKAGDIEVRGLGAEDLRMLSRGAMKRAGEKVTDGRIAAKLTELEGMVGAEPCRWQGDVSRIQCGRAVLELTTPPNLTADGVEWYGHSFAGLTATYAAASSWSWSQGLDDMQRDSKFNRFAKDVAVTTETMMTEGKAVEAVLTKKQAVERSTGVKTVDRVLPPDAKLMGGK